MEHKTFRIVTSISILFIIGIVIGFNLVKDFTCKIVLKVCPVSILMTLSFFYILHYKFTYYSFLTSIALLFCLLGDVFMALYDPRLVAEISDRNFYLIMGGACFLIARIILVFVFGLGIKTRKFIILVSHICFSIPFVILGILFLVHFEYSELSIFVLIYFVLGFGIQLSYAFLRINGIPRESIAACIFGFLGMLCFNISDIFLLTTMLTNLLPNYTINISNCIYWLSMVLITISIVRYSETSYEKEIELKGLRYI